MDWLISVALKSRTGLKNVYRTDCAGRGETSSSNTWHSIWSPSWPAPSPPPPPRNSSSREKLGCVTPPGLVPSVLEWPPHCSLVWQIPDQEPPPTPVQASPDMPHSGRPAHSLLRVTCRNLCVPCNPRMLCYRQNVRAHSLLSPHSKCIRWKGIPDVTVFGSGAFGRRLGHKDGALMNGISTLIKETPERSLTPSAMWGQRKDSCLWTGKWALTKHQHLNPGLPASRTVNFYLL